MEVKRSNAILAQGGLTAVRFVHVFHVGIRMAGFHELLNCQNAYWRWKTAEAAAIKQLSSR
eukprot:11454445-Karenia_brevis.AAC.1